MPGGHPEEVSKSRRGLSPFLYSLSAPVPVSAGWEFIKWAASREAQLQGALATGHIAVTLRSVWQDPAFGKKYNWGGGKFLTLFTESADSGTSSSSRS